MATATVEARSATAASGDGHKHKKNALSDGQGRLAYILLAPTLLVILVVAGIPVVMSIRESFFATNNGVDPVTGMVAGGERFVGLGNFTAIFSGQNPVTGSWGTIDRFWNAFWNTTAITVVCIILETILGVAMALIMSKAFKGRGIVRAGILVPWAIPTIVSALMWKLIFDADGVMNRVLGNQVLWLADTGASFWAVVIADTWKTAPFIGLLTLAGLQTIPAEVYEAAKVDGATTWQQFTRITLPLVKPTLVVAVLFRTLDAFRIFDNIYVLTRGSNETGSVSILGYNNLFGAFNLGLGSAISILIFFCVAIIAFVFIKLLGADVVGSGDEAKQRRAARAARKEGSR